MVFIHFLSQNLLFLEHVIPLHATRVFFIFPKNCVAGNSRIGIFSIIALFNLCDMYFIRLRSTLAHQLERLIPLDVMSHGLTKFTECHMLLFLIFLKKRIGLWCMTPLFAYLLPFILGNGGKPN